jgi:putative RecB family exonuclease
MSEPYPTSLSPSRASDFMTCPLLFRFRSIDRLPEAPSAAAVRGNLVHKALEDLFSLPAPERRPEAAEQLARDAFRDLELTDLPAADAVRGVDGSAPDLRGLIDRYFALEDPQRLEPHAREVAVNVALTEDLEIRGFIDRVDVSPDGRIRIVDYKTGKAPRPAFQDKALFQMRFYGLAWWRLHGAVPARLQLLYLGDGQVVRHDPDEAALEKTERKILALRDAINTAAQAREFTPTPSRLCDWCSFKALCPSFEGTPPPLPERDAWPTAMRSREQGA